MAELWAEQRVLSKAEKKALQLVVNSAGYSVELMADWTAGQKE